MKKLIILVSLLSLGLMSCASRPQKQELTADQKPARSIAQYASDDRRHFIREDGSEEGNYITREIRDTTGKIHILRDFRFINEYERRNLKGIIVEAIPYGNVRGRTVMTLNVNGRSVDTFNVQLRQGRQHFYSDLNQIIGERIAQMTFDYNPREVEVRSITLLINDREDRPEPPPNPGPYPPDPDWNRPLTQIIAYSDDRCTQVITPIAPQDNCGQLETVYASRNLWSFSVNGKCYDIADRSFVGSCGVLQALTRQRVSEPVIELFTDDRCTNKLINVDQRIDCNAWVPFLNSMNIWSVKYENRCVDIVDRGFNAQNCEQIKRTERPPVYVERAIELFSDDRCSQPVLLVQPGEDCARLLPLFGNMKVWSIRFRGQCEDITDTTFANACQMYSR